MHSFFTNACAEPRVGVFLWNGEESVEFGEWRVEFCTAVNLSEPPAADDLPLTGKVADAERLTEREKM